MKIIQLDKIRKLYFDNIFNEVFINKTAVEIEDIEKEIKDVLKKFESQKLNDKKNREIRDQLEKDPIFNQIIDLDMYYKHKGYKMII